MTDFNPATFLYEFAKKIIEFSKSVYTVLMTEIPIGDSTISLWALLGGGVVVTLILVTIIKAFLR